MGLIRSISTYVTALIRLSAIGFDRRCAGSQATHGVGSPGGFPAACAKRKLSMLGPFALPLRAVQPCLGGA